MGKKSFSCFFSDSVWFFFSEICLFDHLILPQPHHNHYRDHDHRPRLLAETAPLLLCRPNRPVHVCLPSCVRLSGNDILPADVEEMQEYASANVELRAVAEVRRVEQQRAVHPVQGDAAAREHPLDAKHEMAVDAISCSPRKRRKNASPLLLFVSASSSHLCTPGGDA